MLNTLEDNTTLDKIHRLFIDNDLSFVSYRLPNEKKITTMLQWQGEPEVIPDINSLKNKSGFVFAPFYNTSHNPIRMILPDMIVDGTSFNKPIQQDIYLNHSLKKQLPQEFKWEEKNDLSKEEYLIQVNQLKQMISQKKLDKLVLSRISTEKKPENFNPSVLFDALHLTYQDAFVYLLHIPDAGLWCGASPEPLLIVSNNNASTVSLAGTRKLVKDYKSEPWDEKEYKEQEIVTTYIDEVLQKFHVKDYTKSGPHNYSAGKIEHLRTVFNIPLDELKDNMYEFLDELHPTPSVCGLPKNISLDLINQTERHEREYYAGFLGPMDTNNHWNLYVNLRCIKAGQNKLAFFLGAGITEGSEAIKEWEETESKKNTMHSMVNKITES